MQRLLLTLIALAGSAIGGAANTQTCNPALDATTPNARFQINGDGTATDLRTDLVWQRCPLGYVLSGDACQGNGTDTFSWQDALQAAASDTLAGASDWRVPNVSELRSIIEYRCYQPAINSVVFPNNDVASESFWTSTPYGHKRLGKQVNFRDGNSSAFGRDTAILLARLVRGN